MTRNLRADLRWQRVKLRSDDVEEFLADIFPFSIVCQGESSELGALQSCDRAAFSRPTTMIILTNFLLIFSCF